jgi:hypothetical protein
MRDPSSSERQKKHAIDDVGIAKEQLGWRGTGNVASARMQILDRETDEKSWIMERTSRRFIRASNMKPTKRCMHRKSLHEISNGEEPLAICRP